MEEDWSPILDYYPPEFECDLNGKQQEWEAVVLIPFIDEKRLLEAVKPRYPHMTPEEKARKNFSVEFSVVFLSFSPDSRFSFFRVFWSFSFFATFLRLSASKISHTVLM